VSEITKVVLYKHGVGYFERQAKVSGNAEVRLGFRAEEMNDVLKSLTVFDSAGGTVSSVSYDNQKPLSRLLEETSLSIPSSGGQISLLHTVRGASVLVSSGNRMVSGQVVGIDERSVQVGQGLASSVRLTIYDEGGALHSFDVAEISNVRFLDEHLKSELKFLFDTLLAATKRDTKNLKLFAKGAGDRKLSISYVVECPIWKTSYRMAISDDDGQKPYLQGWALVDNPQDEDWTDVELSLVSGLPISFVHDLYSPRYLKRREIEVQREAAAGPVMTEAAMLDSFADSFEADDFAEAGFGGPGGGGLGGTVGGRGGAPRAMMQMAPPPAPARAEKMASSQKVETVTQTVGQLFEYRIEQPVTVLRNQSALVPIVGSPFEGQRKILYTPSHRQENPFAVIDFRNTTGLTLEGGPLTVYEGDVYAGECMMDTLAPEESRMLPYAVDLSVEAQVQHEQVDHVTLETIRNSVWSQRKARYLTTRYRFHNKSSKVKELVIEHDIQHGKRVKTPEPISETRNHWRFALTLPAKATTEFPVTVRVEDETRQSLGSGDAQWVMALLQSSRSHVKLTSFLEKASVIAAQLAEVNRAEQVARQRVNEIVGGQGRLRENLSRLSQSHDEARLRSRYVEQLEQQEDELAKLQADLMALQGRRATHTAELSELVAGLSFEETFEEG
jgi:hypothetical protein